MTLDSKDRSPHQVFPRSTWEPERGDPQVLPKPVIDRPSRERMPFGPTREYDRGPASASAGELKVYGPGPWPDGFLQAPDLAGLPWKRARGNEWTTATFRAAVLGWLRLFFRAHAGEGLIGWDITERANGDRMGSVRLAAKDHYLRVGITKRVGREGQQRVEIALAFPPEVREEPYITARLAHAATALETLLRAIR